MKNLPLGRPILVILALAAISGATVLFQRPPAGGDLRFWVFADSHAKTFRPILPAFESAEGVRVELSLISNRALSLRLLSMFLSRNLGPEVPDVAEIEIGSVGRFFRPPVDRIGFLPLNDFLSTRGAREIASTDTPGQAGWNARLLGSPNIYTHDGNAWHPNPGRSKPDMWIDRIVRTRFAPWSKEGTIFGVPHDVHPVALAYRDDLYREAGIDLATCKTWPEFHAAALRFRDYWRSKGYPHRHALELREASPEDLVVMLLQRGINPVDDFGNIHLTNPKVAQTIAFYARLVAGADKVASEAAGGMGVFAKDAQEGNLCALLMPDWRIRYTSASSPRRSPARSGSCPSRDSIPTTPRRAPGAAR